MVSIWARALCKIPLSNITYYNLTWRFLQQQIAAAQLFSRLFASSYLWACPTGFHMAQSSSAVGQVRAQPSMPVKAIRQSDARSVATSCVAGPGFSRQVHPYGRGGSWDL